MAQISSKNSKTLRGSAEAEMFIEVLRSAENQRVI